MNRAEMLMAIRRVYPHWGSGKYAKDKTDKQIQAVYFRLKREGLIK